MNAEYDWFNPLKCETLSVRTMNKCYAVRSKFQVKICSLKLNCLALQFFNWDRQLYIKVSMRRNYQTLFHVECCVFGRYWDPKIRPIWSVWTSVMSKVYAMNTGTFELNIQAKIYTLKQLSAKLGRTTYSYSKN